MEKADTLPIIVILSGLMTLTAMGAFIWSVRSWNKFKILRFIAFYSAASFLQNCLDRGFTYIAPHSAWRHTIVNTATKLFLVTEFSLCSIYLAGLIRSKRKKEVVKISGIVFLLFFLVCWLIHPVLFYQDTTNYLNYFFVLEDILLIIPCLFYYYELFKYPESTGLLDDPNFWVVSGIFFLNACCFPLFLTLEFVLMKMPDYKWILFSVNYILYSILFLLFIRAFQCNEIDPRQTLSKIPVGK